MLETAITAITAQQGTQEKNPIRWMLGEQLKELCHREPHAAELIAQDLEQPELSLASLQKTFDDFAAKHKVGNHSVITPAQGETLIRAFFGLPDTHEEPTANVSAHAAPKVVNLFDLLEL